MPDHCILDYAQQPPRLRCLHCGHEHWILLPMPVRELTGLSDDFIARHRRCPHKVSA